MLASRYLRIRPFWEVTKLRSYNRKGNYYTRDFVGKHSNERKNVKTGSASLYSKAKAVASEHFFPESRIPQEPPEPRWCL